MLVFAVSAGVLTAGSAIVADGRRAADFKSRDGRRRVRCHRLTALRSTLVQLSAPTCFKPGLSVRTRTNWAFMPGPCRCCCACGWLARQDRWGNLEPLVLGSDCPGGWLALLLAMGEAGGLYRLQAFIPVVNRFRFPCRAIVLVQLAHGRRCGDCDGDPDTTYRNATTSLRRKVTARLLLATFAAQRGTRGAFGPLVWPEFVASPRWSGPDRC